MLFSAHNHRCDFVITAAAPRTECVMTYMWPNYVRVPLPWEHPPAAPAGGAPHPEPQSDLHRALAAAPYSLWRYHEGGGRGLGASGGNPGPSAEGSRRVPVLFLPGNSGSYRQARVAS